MGNAITDRSGWREKESVGRKACATEIEVSKPAIFLAVRGFAGNCAVEMSEPFSAAKVVAIQLEGIP